jgi:ketosteroid isomerase-like protein
MPRSPLLSSLLCLTLTVAASVAGAQSPARARSPKDSTPDERTLVKLENDWAQAVIRRDAKAIRALVAPQWVYTDESGRMTREQGITAFTTGTDTVLQAGNDEMQIILHEPNVAVVTGILWMRGRGPNGPFLHRYRYTDTWQRQRGTWRAIASQDHLLPTEAGGGQ